MLGLSSLVAMFEAIFVLGLFVALVLAGGRSTPVKSPTIRLSDLADLPCPWCMAATSEHDTQCASCGQAFGIAKQRSTRSTSNPSDW